MPFVPLPMIRPQQAAEPPQMVRQVGREDVLWDRPVFKAPPLKFSLSHREVQAFAEDLRRIGSGNR
jgi:hypothetical protein